MEDWINQFQLERYSHVWFKRMFVTLGDSGDVRFGVPRAVQQYIADSVTTW
jgi:hypothetical protein